jgi:cathepsin L
MKKPYVRTHKTSGAPLPLTVDWRGVSPSVFSAVKDQGSCGSCWAHGSTENIETYYATATGQMFALSQQEITACAPNPNDCGGFGGCQGSIAELAYEYVVQHGIAQEWSNPYTAFFGTTGNCSNTTTPMVWLSGYVKLPANDQTSVMDALAHTGPLAVNVDASSWFLYESGVFDGCHYSNNITIDHVVQLVGYGRDSGLGMDYWLIRNSWNPTFGENGFIRIRRTDVACGWDVEPQQGTACNGSPDQLWVCGECGIVFDTSYPVVKTN